MMPGGSGIADPGAQKPLSIFYDAARIRDCGSGRAEPLSIFYVLIPVPYFFFVLYRYRALFLIPIPYCCMGTA